MIKNTISNTVPQDVLGHADIETILNTYTSVFNKFKEDEIQKFFIISRSCIKIALKNL